jgi:HlyD family secretion protein
MAWESEGKSEMLVRRSLIVLTLLVFILPYAVFSSRANMTQTESASSFQYYTVQRGGINVAVTAIGTIESQSTGSVSFPQAGRVVEVLVQPGDVVFTGDILARQASDAEQLAYERASLSLQLAELQKQDLLEPADDAEIRIAEANVDSAWGAYLGIQNSITPEDIQAAEIQYQQAQTAQQAAADARTQADAGQVDQVYQLLDAQVGRTAFEAEIARLQLESLTSSNSGALNAAYARVIQAQKELDQAKAGPTPADIDNADISIQQAQAQLDQAKLAVDEMTLFSPFDGIVSAVNVEIGALGLPSSPAIELTDVSALRVMVQVDEIDIRQIAEGMSAQVRLDALPDVELLATVDRIALVGTNEDGIISYDVEVSLNELDPRVRVGMTAEASVIVEQRDDVLVVPNLYIRLDRDQNKAFVNILQPDGTLEEAEVQLGLQGQDSSEVLSGLEPGDVVAIDLSSDRIALFGE